MAKKRVAGISALIWVVACGFLFKGPGKPKTPEDVFFAPKEDIRERPAFQEILHYRHNPLAFEHTKIDFLIDCVERSPYTFIRNKASYSGARAAAHLLWKYQRRASRVETVEAFIEEIATRSAASGDPYLVRLEEGKAYPMRDVLFNELRRAELYLKERAGEPIT